MGRAPELYWLTARRDKPGAAEVVLRGHRQATRPFNRPTPVHHLLHFVGGCHIRSSGFGVAGVPFQDNGLSVGRNPALGLRRHGLRYACVLDRAVEVNHGATIGRRDMGVNRWVFKTIDADGEFAGF